MLNLSKISEEFITTQLDKDIVSSGFIDYNLDFSKDYLICSIVLELNYNFE